MFSPTVSAPLTLWSGRPAGDSAEYWSMSALARRSNSARSAASHQSVMAPSPSYLLPWSSKPWPISCPITAPMPP